MYDCKSNALFDRFVGPRLGFSFIELMVVVSIISILSIVSVQGYLRYVRRGQMIGIVNVLEAYKAPINLSLLRSNACPSQLLIDNTFGATTMLAANGSISMTLPGVNLVSLSYNVGTSSTNYPLCRINAGLNATLGAGQISLVVLYNANNGLFEWRCGFWDSTATSLGSANASLAYAISSCKATNLSTL